MAAAQFYIFLGAMRLGAVFALLYALPAAARRAFRLSQWWVSALDLLFFFGVGLVSFLYLLSVLDGQLRGFVLIGEGLGALLVRCSAYPLLLRVLEGLLGLLRRILQLPLSLLAKSGAIVQNAWGRAAPRLKNAINFSRQIPPPT